MPGQTTREKLPIQRFSFPRESRLLRPSDYKNVFQHGKKAVGRCYICYVNRQEGEGSKLGIAVSRKVGNAVVRNRIKRYIREYFRTHKPLFQQDVQVVVVARTQAAQLTSQESGQALEHLLKNRGVL